MNELIRGLKYGLKLKVTFIFPSKDTLMAPSQLDYDADKKSVIGFPFGSPTLYSLVLIKVLPDKRTPSSPLLHNHPSMLESRLHLLLWLNVDGIRLQKLLSCV